ncbi:MAG TPA: hypothetical protein PLY87_30275 [Planctomycetaceae bacterium]|nr:hypothetical protein [Planctomycetaceae bacterium]
MRRCTLTIVLLALFSHPAIAQDAPIDMIPASASFVIRLQAPETTIEELGAFINKVQPGFGEIAKAQVPVALGQMLSNPTLVGIDKSKDWYVAVFPDDARQMKEVYLLPTTDSQEVKDAMGERFSYAENNGWLVCSKSVNFRDEFASVFSGSAKSIAETLDDQTKSALNSGHLCVVVNGAALKEAYADELASADEGLEGLLQTLSAQMATANPQMELEYVLDVYRSLGKALLQGVRDSKSAAVSVTLTETALQIDKLLTVEADSQTDTFFQSQPVSDMARLTALPEGLAGYGAISGDPTSLLDWSEQLASSMFKEKDTLDKMKKSMALMRQAKFGTLVMGGDLVPEEDAALQYFAVGEISPASVVREAFQIFGTGIEYEIAGIRQKQSFELNAETIDGQAVDIMRTEQELPPGLDPTGMQRAINEKMYGPDGMVQRIVVKGDLLLQTLGGGPGSMKRLLTPVNWSDSKLLEARARQHDKANLLLLADLPNMFKKFAQMILGTGAIPIPLEPEQLDDLKIAPSYAGVSVAVEKQRLHARTSIPLETFQGFVQIGLFLQKAFAGQQQ